MKIRIVLWMIIFMKLKLGSAYNTLEIHKACRPEDGLFYDFARRFCYSRSDVFQDAFSCWSQSRNIACNDDEYPCRIPARCVVRSSLNTESGCSMRSVERLLVPCRPDEFLCEKSRLCIQRWAVLDGKEQCNSHEKKDISDETSEALLCNRDEFRCQESGRCIPREWVLDDIVDCAQKRFANDLSDETQALASCDEREFRCVTNGRCVRRCRVMDGYPDCTDSSDEKEAFVSCHNKTEFRCEHDGRCIPRAWIKDGTKNCKDGSDELAPNNYACYENEFPCHNGKRCIEKKYLCDGIDHCGDCSDEIEGCPLPTMSRCPGDLQHRCLSQFYVCDSFSDCPGGKDQDDTTPGFKCEAFVNALTPNYCTIPQWTLGDEHAMCADRSDVCFENGTFTCAYCMDGSLVAKRQMCDGIVDCEDLSDECLCVDYETCVEVQGQDYEVCMSTLCSNVCYGDASLPCNHCRIGEIYCQEDRKCINKSDVCNKKIDCPLSRIDEVFCGRDISQQSKNETLTDFDCWEVPAEIFKLAKVNKLLDVYKNMINKRALKCNGVFECPWFEDECNANCTSTPSQCHMFEKKRFQIPKIFGLCKDVDIEVRVCKDHLQNSAYLVGPSICNGIKECPDGLDEEFCPERFKCEAGEIAFPNGQKQIVSIERKQECNRIPDCLDYSDEINCSIDTHYYCAGGTPLFVPIENVMDGKQDCDDNSDECPTFAYDDNPFSSREEMISSIILRVLIWIMATFSIFGNLVVLIDSWRSRASPQQQSPMSRCNRIVIANLATADLLMGIALLIIAMQSSIMSGKYCQLDKKWRTGVLCRIIGALTVLSCETSVGILVVLTLLRLYGICKPFKSRHIKPRTAYMAVVISWIISAVLSLFPVIPVINQSTIPQVITEPATYFRSTSVSWDDMRQFAIRVSSFSNVPIRENTVSNWDSTLSLLYQDYPDHAPKVIGYFGYYSAHGVCIPRIFRSKNSPPLHPLSLIIVSINFVSLIFIIIAYALIYHKSTSNRPVSGNSSVASTDGDRNTSMQRKITVLIATDVVCWLPICIMTFISVTIVPISGVLYAVAAIVFLPFNSSLNPIIYSNGFQSIRVYLRNTTSNLRGNVNAKGSRGNKVVQMRNRNNGAQRVNEERHVQ